MRTSARLVLVMAACGALAGGCLSRPYEFSAARAERYIAATPGLPAERAEALRTGQVVAGMTPEEVRLCLGKPQERRHVERGGQTLRVWEYVRLDRSRDGLDRSGMWDQPVPLARVDFSPAGRVESFRLFAPGRNGAPPPAGNPPPPPPVGNGVSTPAGNPPPPAPANVERRPVEILPEPVTDAGFEGWPELVLSGVVVGAGEPVAIINRREMAEGESIEDVRVLEITAKGVKLKRGEEVRFLRAGGSTRP